MALIISKPPSKEYIEGYERVFQKKKKTLSVYVASSWENKENVSSFIHVLKSRGFVVTCDWTVHEDKPCGKSWEEDAENDLVGVRCADHLVLLYPYRWSSTTEFGMALGQYKKCIAIGIPDYSKNLFFCHPLVTHVEKQEDAIQILEQWRG